MARTKGHGNPRWTRDETILALDLYFNYENEPIPKRTAEIVELSELLRRIPFHSHAARRPTFRNVAGVAFKLQNLRRVAIGAGGLSNVSKTDRQVWAEYGARREEVRRLARLLREGIEAEDAEFGDHLEWPVFSEGALLTRTHRSRERAPGLRKSLLDSRRTAGESLHCDLCGCRSRSSVARYEETSFEVHHLVPISDLGERETRLSDVALLCASCHRMIHRAIAHERRWLNLDEARSVIQIPFNGDVRPS